MRRNHLFGRVEVRPIDLGPECGEQIAEYGGVEVGRWDFGDGRGLVEFEALASPGACICLSCRLTRGWLASLPAGLRTQA